MANKYILGSVGFVEALRYNASLAKWEVAFRSKTLTDSGINISTTKDDIRAGTGAPIVTSFYHDPSVEITLTDVIFDSKYVEAQLGAEFTKDGGKAYYTQEVAQLDGTSINLDHTAQPLAGTCNDAVVIWITEKGSNEWYTADQAITNGMISAYTSTSITFANAGDYCIRYLYIDANAQIAEIKSEIIPQELFLVITAPIYAADACSASNGKRAGKITYEIPRFRLNGGQDFAMNMSSNQTMSLSGVALAAENECSGEGANLLRLIIQYDGVHWYDDVVDLLADEECLVQGLEPVIYGLHKDNKVTLIDNAELIFTPALTAGKWTSSGEVNVKLKDKEAISDTFTIAAA